MTTVINPAGYIPGSGDGSNIKIGNIDASQIKKEGQLYFGSRKSQEYIWEIPSENATKLVQNSNFYTTNTKKKVRLKGIGISPMNIERVIMQIEESNYILTEKTYNSNECSFWKNIDGVGTMQLSFYNFSETITTVENDEVEVELSLTYDMWNSNFTHIIIDYIELASGVKIVAANIGEPGLFVSRVESINKNRFLLKRLDNTDSIFANERSSKERLKEVEFEVGSRAILIDENKRYPICFARMDGEQFVYAYKNSAFKRNDIKTGNGALKFCVEHENGKIEISRLIEITLSSNNWFFAEAQYTFSQFRVHLRLTEEGIIFNVENYTSKVIRLGILGLRLGSYIVSDEDPIYCGSYINTGRGCKVWANEIFMSKRTAEAMINGADENVFNYGILNARTAVLAFEDEEEGNNSLWIKSNKTDPWKRFVCADEIDEIKLRLDTLENK